MSDSGLYLGIDVGSTMVKAALFDEAGSEQGIGRGAVRLSTPAPGHVERSVDEVWAAVVSAVRGALSAPAASDRGVRAVSITGTGNGLILLDRRGAALTPHIMSSDTRTADLLDRWRAAGLEPEIWRNTWQVPWPGQPVALLAWLKENSPGLLREAASLSVCKDYVRFRLCGALAGEITELSSSALVFERDARVVERHLDVLGVPWVADLIPPVRISPAEIAGEVTPTAAEETGLAAGTPVVAGASDILAAILGSGIASPGEVHLVAGTWGINQHLITGPARTDGSVFATTLSHDPDLLLELDGSPSSAGNLSWFMRTLAADVAGDRSAYDVCDEEARAAALDFEGPYFVPHLFGAFGNGHARGAFIGIGAWHQRGEMVRAMYDGIASEHRWHVERLLGSSPRPARMRLAGGATRSELWTRMFAETMGAEIEVPRGSEAGALGVAVLAQAASEHVGIPEAVARMTAVDRRVVPDPSAVREAARRYEAYLIVREATTSLRLAAR